MKALKNKFFVMVALFLLGGLVTPEIKAQTGHPIVTRKANGQDYTKAEIKAKLSQSGIYWDNVRNEIVAETNKTLERSGEQLRVTTKNIAWIIDSSVYIPKNEYGDQINNGYTIDYKSIKYVTTRKTDGNYLVFQYKKANGRILDPSCLNPQKEIVLENISEKPVTKLTKAVTETEMETETEVEVEECWEYVWRTQTTYTTEYVEVQPHNPRGDYTGYRGLQTQSYTKAVRVPHTTRTRIKVPCGEGFQAEEEIPYTENGEPERTWCERHPVACRALMNIRVNVGVQVSNNNYTTQQQQDGFTSVTPGKQGGVTVVTPGGQSGGFQPVTPGKRLGQ